jgi:hypothetical protein
MDTEEFIARARSKHGTRYGYDKTRYATARDKVIITCPRHGDFSQTARSHLEGYGCKRCAIEETAQKKWAKRKSMVCSHCGTTFTQTASASERGEGKYCSRACYDKAVSPVPRTCPTCNNSFHPKKPDSKYCSITCAKTPSLEVEEVIARFRDKHGERYDYSKVNYKNMNTPVTIMCSIHGEWRQRPADHILGRGCQKCAQQLVKALRLQESRRLSVIVKCGYCGLEIPRPPHKAKRTKYCSPECASLATRLSVEEFKNKAHELYGELYNYDQVVFSVSRESKLQPVILGCSEHGNFSITVGAHLKGAGCPYCSGRKLQLRSFLERAAAMNKLRGVTYDYSRINSIQSGGDEVEIVCPKHGMFRQSATRHLVGDGCPTCAIELRATMNAERAASTWKERAISVHGDKYDYSRSNYISAKEKILIKCKIHGDFWQAPNNHINGAGCPSCGATGFDSSKSGMLYYIRISNGEQTAWKIGITNFDVAQRFRGEPAEITVIKTWGYVEGRVALERETEILRRYRSLRYLGPRLLRNGGNSELFETDILELDPEYG